jgi:hypothetical protein
MNAKQRKIELQQKQKPRTKLYPVNEAKNVFSYTIGFHIMKTIKRIIGVIGCLYFMGISTDIHAELSSSWYFTVLWMIAIISSIIGIFKFGELGRVYKDDIYIENNRIFYHYIIKLKQTTDGNWFAIDVIKRVEVKWNKIVIWGDIINMYTGKLIPQKKKLVFPKSIKNVDEFIRFAKSQVVAE